MVRTPHGGFNRLVVSVTVCEPGTERCATIDDVMVDTGSTGLRLEASAVPRWLNLPPFLGADLRPLAECLRFVHDTAWGPLVRADVRFGGLIAKALPLQVIDDIGGSQPQVCPRSDARPTSNGTLGVSQHLLDCQGACEQDAAAPGVFINENTDWTPVQGRVTPDHRLPNPISYLPGHDNGITIELPAPRNGGAEEVVGKLTFGIGIADGNRPFSDVFRLDGAGHFTTFLGGKAYPHSYIDSGTETYVTPDLGLPRCHGMSWAYCIKPRRQLYAAMVRSDGTHIPVPFTVGDYRTRRKQHVGAVDDVAEAAVPQSTAFVWGAPFFLGRRVSFLIEGKKVPGAPEMVGPFYGLD